MPIRIKPLHDLGPCILTLDSIEGILKLLENDFHSVACSANDNVWEIYDEPSDSFLAAVSERETLDSFKVEGETEFEEIKIELVFNEDEAKVICTAKPAAEHWFEHFLIDLKKHVLSPSVKQLLVHKYGKGEIYLRFPLFVPFDTGTVVTTPYCKIVIQEKPPNPFIENIKANLVSSIIWAVVVFILGGMITFIAQWLLRKYGINLNPFK